MPQTDTAPALVLVDFKLDEKGHAHILEFGDGANSCYTGYAALNKGEKDPLRPGSTLPESILYQLGFEALAKQTLGKVILASPARGLWQHAAARLNLHHGKGKFVAATCGIYQGMGYHAYYLPEDRDDNKLPEFRETFDRLTAEDLVVIAHEDSDEASAYAIKLRQYFAANNIPAKVANSDGGIIAMCQNKFMYAACDVNKVMPAQLIDIEQDLQAQLDQLWSMNPEDKVVIKPVNAQGGEGVTVLKRAQLPTFLKFLQEIATIKQNAVAIFPAGYTSLSFSSKFTKVARAYDAHFENIPSIHYWYCCLEPRLLLQAYAPAKPVTAFDQRYNATGRMVMAVDIDGNVAFADGYWKLPKKPISSEEDAFVELAAYISDVHAQDGDSNCARISPEDFNIITESLRPQVATLVREARRLPLEQRLALLKQSADPAISAYSRSTLAQQMQPYIPTAPGVPRQAYQSEQQHVRTWQSLFLHSGYQLDYYYQETAQHFRNPKTADLTDSKGNNILHYFVYNFIFSLDILHDDNIKLVAKLINQKNNAGYTPLDTLLIFCTHQLPGDHLTFFLQAFQPTRETVQAALQYAQTPQHRAQLETYSPRPKAETHATLAGSVGFWSGTETSTASGTATGGGLSDNNAVTVDTSTVTPSTNAQRSSEYIPFLDDRAQTEQASAQSTNCCAPPCCIL